MRKSWWKLGRSSGHKKLKLLKKGGLCFGAQPTLMNRRLVQPEHLTSALTCIRVGTTAFGVGSKADPWQALPRHFKLTTSQRTGSIFRENQNVNLLPVIQSTMYSRLWLIRKQGCFDHPQCYISST